MTLIRWNPWGDVAGLHREFDRFFDHRVPVSAPTARRGYAPAVDVHEGEEAYTLSFDLPGVPIADVHIEVHQGRLTVRGERKLDRGEKGEGYRTLERTDGKFARAFNLPDNIDADGIAARSKDGVLTITLPKRPEAQPQRIEIEG